MNIPLTPIRFLRYAAQQFPAKTAVVCGNERLTYSQFASRVSRLAGALREMGVQPGDRVAYLSGNCHRLLEAYYGVLEAGAVLLPLNIRLTPNELAYILNDSGAKVLLFQEQFSPMVEGFQRELQSVKKFVGLDHAPTQSWAVQQSYENLIAAAAPYGADIMQVDENAHHASGVK